MADLLTTEEKIGMINQHIKNIELNQYNLDLSLIEENALDKPDSGRVESLEAQIAEAATKINALKQVLTRLEADQGSN
jgi:hypothetical protein